MSKLSKFIFVAVAFFPLFSNVGPVLAQQSTTSKPSASKFIPQCALNNPTGKAADEGECRSISIFVILILQAASYLFTIVGALALIFFIYGGFTLILSRGAPDAVKKGKDILVASIIGLVIVFGAYMLVRFLGTAVGLKSGYLLF